MSEPHVIVLHILDGKGFPWKKGKGLVAECSFNGDVQCTDPVPESITPFWNHEFKWELSKKRLTQFKNDRVPVKVTFYGNDAFQRQALGFVVLSLRDGAGDVRAKWYQLLHPRSQPPPEIHLGFRVCTKADLDEEEAQEEKRRATLSARKAHAAMTPVPPIVPAEPRPHAVGGSPFGLPRSVAAILGSRPPGAGKPKAAAKPAAKGKGAKPAGKAPKGVARKPTPTDGDDDDDEYADDYEEESVKSDPDESQAGSESEQESTDEDEEENDDEDEDADDAAGKQPAGAQDKEKKKEAKPKDKKPSDKKPTAPGKKAAKEEDEEEEQEEDEESDAEDEEEEESSSADDEEASSSEDGGSGESESDASASDESEEKSKSASSPEHAAKSAKSKQRRQQQRPPKSAAAPDRTARAPAAPPARPTRPSAADHQPRHLQSVPSQEYVRLKNEQRRTDDELQAFHEEKFIHQEEVARLQAKKERLQREVEEEEARQREARERARELWERERMMRIERELQEREDRLRRELEEKLASKRRKRDEEDAESEHSPPPPQPAPPPVPVAPPPPPFNEAEAERHYRFSVDLKCVREFAFPVVALYIKYNYPLFGNPDPVYTQPPIEIMPGGPGSGFQGPPNFSVSLGTQPFPGDASQAGGLQRNAPAPDAPLHNAFCVMEFALRRELLETSFAKVPLVLEVMDKGRTTYDRRIGVVSIDLNEVLSATKSPVPGGTLQIFDGWLPITAVDDAYVRIGLLRAVVSLEDLGAIRPAAAPPAPAAFLGMPPAAPAANPAQHPEAAAKSRLAASGQQPAEQPVDEYFEAGVREWKKAHKEKWRIKMRAKEAAYLSALEQEWKRNEAEIRRRLSEQEAVVAKKVAECAKLDEKLRAMVAEMERRQNKLAAAEDDLKRRKIALQVEFEAKVAQVEDLGNRTRMELAHFKEVEQMRTFELSNQKKDLERRVKEAEAKQASLEKTLEQRSREADARYHALEREFLDYKNDQTAPAAQLQAEVLALSALKTELERKLQSARKKKKGFKDEVHSLKDDIARIQQKASEDEKERLRREQREIDELRARLQAREREQTELSSSERQELEALKAQLQSQKNAELNPASNFSAPYATRPNQPLFELSRAFTPSGVLTGSLRLPPSYTSSRTFGRDLDQNVPRPLESKENQSQAVQPDVTERTKPAVDAEKLTRLLKEKDSLLNTGLYTEHDRLIRELNEEIERTRGEYRR